ncbi:TonB-dependent receptor domain-containing protein [Mangrovimonas aestuarii]|uniref:TonB-dependent receptor domain-containing protein n=1 Tax=Mangrovimonas aestuarii TaxID=3018443 RepID=UPI0023781555|nr:TonB-dependent receptor [Mangrovimonas aestuarii]
MKHILTVSIFLISLVLQAQTSVVDDNLRTGSVKGRVIDASLNAPLPYVTVVVKNMQGKTLTGGITDDSGKFKIIGIPIGKAMVSIQYVGFKTESREINITSSNNNIDLGDIKLVEDLAELNEVTIVAEVSTIEQKVDRKVVNVGKDLTTSGATATDIMNNIPSVSVDQQTGNISLRGNENVRVMVDGKLSNIPVAQLLRQIPSTSIKQIELITNPSAKYNPEGMSGIINIILYKNTNIGFNGNVNIGLTKEIEAKFNSSVDMNYRHGKFNVYGNYGANTGKYVNSGYVTRFTNGSQQFFNFDNNNKSHLFKVGLDFYLNDNNTLSVFTNQNLFNGKGSGVTDINYINQPLQSQIFYNTTDNVSSEYNFVFNHKFAKEGEKLELEVDYNDFDQDENADFDFINIVFPPNYEDAVDTKRELTTVNLDYTNPINDKTKLEVGLQARLFDSKIGYLTNRMNPNLEEDGVPNNGDELVPAPDTDFDYSRDIYSAYATFGQTFEKWSYQAGLRAEQVDVNAPFTTIQKDGLTELTPFENNYFQLYPSAFLTYTPNDKNSYQLSYSRRVDRPGIEQINPIRQWSTPLVSSFGNPELLPQFTNSVETNFTRKVKNGSITAGVFYRIIEDQISRVIYVDRTDETLQRSILTFDNFDNTSAYGIELSSNYKPTKWWSFNASFDLYSQVQKGITEFVPNTGDEQPLPEDIETEVVEVTNAIWNFRMNNNFKATKQLTFSLFAMYRGEQEGVQFTRKPMYFVNTGLRYSCLEDRATISFNYNDIFNTMKFQFESKTPFPSEGEFNWESNTWYIGLSYRFGGNKYRALQRKRRDSDVQSGSGGFM